MDNPGNNKHFNVLIWVGRGSKNEYSLYYWENVFNCERPLTHRILSANYCHLQMTTSFVVRMIDGNVYKYNLCDNLCDNIALVIFC